MGFFVSVKQRELNQKLEERTTQVLKNYISFVKKIDLDIVSRELIKQSIRSMGSIGANYREANESLSKADFLYRLRIVRKEAKETLYWLNVLEASCSKIQSQELTFIKDECTQLFKIFCKMINNIEKKSAFV